MDLILDTNALSAMADGDPDAAKQLAGARELALPVVVLGEFRFGFAQSRRRRLYERWLEEVISVSLVLDVIEATSKEYAALRLELKEAGTPIPSNDLWIAALARQHALPILSRDRHFDLVKGLRRLDW
jgi:predicted nucleic acid-binding protein